VPTGQTTDVAVVGAGLAGLAVATRLVERGVSTVVLEARTRVGGRTLSRPLGRGTFDLGAQFVGPSHRRVIALAAELGVEIFPAHTDGRKVLDLGRGVETYAGSIPSLSPVALTDLHLTIRRLDRLSSAVPADRPDAASGASELDGVSLESWKRATVRTRAARDVLDGAVRAIFGAEPAELSLLFFLFYLRSGGGLVSLTDDAQRSHFAGGAQRLAELLAERLGDRVRLGAPVRSISEDADGVTLVSDTAHVRARYCVVALPPALAARIAFDPPLSGRRDQLLQRVAMGATVKCVATYDRPFWRERGLSGEGVSTVGPITATFDDTPADGGQPALLGFVVGDAARRWATMPEASRRREAADALARLFGPEAATPTGYMEKNWAEAEWTRGCPVGVMAPGVLSAYGGGLREPVGRLHWAGTETAVEWNGYMEGALESAERAVAEVTSRLDTTLRAPV
jgi:monoamine oxidase